MSSGSGARRGGEQPKAVVVITGAVERLGPAEFPGTVEGNRSAGLEARLATLADNVTALNARSALLKEQRDEERVERGLRLQSQAVWVSRLSLLVSAISLAVAAVACWAALRGR